MKDKYLLLLIEDNEDDTIFFKRALSKAPFEYTLHIARTGKEAIKNVTQHPYDVIFLDYMLPDMDGLSLLEEFKKKGIELPIIFFTGYGSEEIAVQAMKKGASDYIVKNVGTNHLLKIPELIQQKTKEYKLMQEKKRIEMLKRNLISLVSHEMRGPLAAILNGLSLLKTTLPFDQLNNKVKKIFSISEKAGKDMMFMLDNFLLLSKIEAREIEEVIKETNINSLLHEIYESVKWLADEKGVKIILKLDKKIPTVKIASFLFSRAVINLIDNAIKFSPPDRNIYVSSKLSNGNIEIIVEDEGPGIPPEYLPVIFNKYKKVKKSTKGLGLGLYIVKKIVTEVLNGTIKVKNRPRGGAEFRIEIPIHHK